MKSTALFDAYANNRSWQINYYNERIQAMQNLVTQAEALQKQLQGGRSSTPGSFGDALALMSAHFNAIKTTQFLPVNPETTQVIQPSDVVINLQITDTAALSDSSSNFQADIDALLQHAKDEKAAAEAKLENLRSPGTDQSTIDEIASKIRVLETELEIESAQLKELTSKRDLSWQAYQTLEEKVTEIQNSEQTSPEVALVEPAVPPLVGIPRGTARNTMLAGIFGFLAGMIGVLGIEWWKTSGLHQPKDTLSSSSK